MVNSLSGIDFFYLKWFLKLFIIRTEGLTNEHQKEVDKLLREIQTMKEK